MAFHSPLENPFYLRPIELTSPFPAYSRALPYPVPDGAIGPITQTPAAGRREVTAGYVATNLTPSLAKPKRDIRT